MLDGQYTAVLDRIVDESTAVLLVEADGDVLTQRNEPIDRVPEAGRHEGAVFEVTVDEGVIVAWDYRPKRETARHERLQEKFDRLAKRLDDGG